MDGRPFRLWDEPLDLDPDRQAQDKRLGHANSEPDPGGRQGHNVEAPSDANQQPKRKPPLQPQAGGADRRCGDRRSEVRVGQQRGIELTQKEREGGRVGAAAPGRRVQYLVQDSLVAPSDQPGRRANAQGDRQNQDGRQGIDLGADTETDARIHHHRQGRRART